VTHDQNKKTLRHFQCRDYLWDIFEQMSQELECSTDYLINEAMRQYARSRNYGTRAPSSPGFRAPPGPAPVNPTPGAIPSLRSSGPSGRPAIPSAPPPPPSRGGYSASPGGYGAPTSSGGYGAPQGHYPQTGGGGFAPQPGYGSRPPPPPGQSSFPPPPTQRPPAYGVPNQAPPPLPGQHRGPSGGAQPPLYVIFNGQKIPIGKPEFVIGRGSKTADLPIKDGNISRRHAAVVWEGGGYWMKDLGSTNGVEYAGQRIEQKQIGEGDIFQICDYELRFTYR
jgi:hypothetical protein